MQIGIITPTTGTPFLKQCIESAQQQSYSNYHHYVVCDGSEHLESVKAIIQPYNDNYDVVRITH